MTDGKDEMAARRFDAARRAHETRRRRELEEGRVPAGKVKWETMRREQAFGRLDPKDDVEKAVVEGARGAIARARSKGLPYDEDLPRLMLARCRNQAGRCAMSGEPFSLEVMSRGKVPLKPLGPSIDRIDSQRGYTLDNCRLIAFALNAFFSDWGSDVALRLARGLCADASGASLEAGSQGGKA
jgi:hypothetical protein